MSPARTKLYVTFWGTRGSIPTPGANTEKYGGNTPCVSVQYQDTHIILDAGTGIRNLGLALAEDYAAKRKPPVLHLLLSHTHWDHIQGLPFFQPAYMKDARITIYGSPKKEKFLESILRGQMDVNYFPVDMKDLAADISITEISDDKLKIGGVEIGWQEQVCHPGGSVRYKLKAGERTIVYASDVELEHIFPPGKDRRKKELSNEYLAFIEAADLLIADGQYTEDDYPLRAGFGHTEIPLIVKLAARQKVRQLAVFHHDPLRSDTQLDELWAQYAPKYSSAHPPLNIFWAREGMTLAL